MNKHPEWEQFNKERKKQGKQPVSFEDWFRYYKDNRVRKCIKYLGLDIDSPNYGTRNKQELTRRTINLIADWRQGEYDKWVNLLSIRLGLSSRTVVNNYLNPLIKIGIILQRGNHLVFNGIPTEENKGA